MPLVWLGCLCSVVWFLLFVFVFLTMLFQLLKEQVRHAVILSQPSVEGCRQSILFR